MGAWSTSSFDPSTWSITTSSSSTSGNVILGTGVNYYANYVSFSIDFIKTIASTVRAKIEELCKKSDYFAGSVAGICGIASRLLHKEILLSYPSLTLHFGYLANTNYRHIFLFLPKEKNFIADDYIIDITADIYGEEAICVMPLSTTNINEKPWWDTVIFYYSESGLMARQRKDQWPCYQISINSAKSKKRQIEIITQGQSDVAKGKLKVGPLDKESETYLEKLAKGDLLQLNLAKLMLDPDPNVIKFANKIAQIITSR